MAHIFTDGELLTAEKTNEHLNHTLIEPEGYAPVVDLGAATTEAQYVRVGRLVTVQFLITFTGTPSAGLLRMTTPAPVGLSIWRYGIGSAIALDGGASGTRRSLTVVAADTDKVGFIVDSLATNATVTNAVPWAFAATDTVAGTFTYMEA